MSNTNNETIKPVDGSTEVPVGEAGKILKASGYKVSNSGVEAFVSLKDINKIYPNGVQAVYDFNIDIEENDFIVLVGPSGCGKSTTLRMIAGLEDITSGYLYIDKVLSNYASSKDRDISMVFQNYALYPQMTVYDNIAFPLRARKFRRPVVAMDLKASVQVLDVLEHRIEEYVETLNEAKNKGLNYTTVNQYISTKMKICDAAVKLLAATKVIKAVDFEVADENGVTVREALAAKCKQTIEAENARLVKEGYEYDSEYRLLKDGALQYAYVKMSEEEIREKVFGAAEILDLGPYLDRRPRELSGGQMQRVALGRAIVRNAKLFLMDEPLSNLDAKLRVQMRSEIVRIHEQIGATTIYVTHDQTEAMTMATKIVVMSKGWVQQIGTPQEIYYNPKNIFVATFIGSPAMNIFDAQYNKGTLTFSNGYTIKLSKQMIARHNKYYEEKVADLERMLATADFQKMHALKLVDKVLFKLDEQLDLAALDKKLAEVLEDVRGLACEEEVKALLTPFNDKLEELVEAIKHSYRINAKHKLLEIKEVIDQITDEYGIEAQQILLQLISSKTVDINLDDNKLPLYNEFIAAVNKAVALLEALNSSTTKIALSKLEQLNVEGQLDKEAKTWLLSLRKPLLTFEKIPSSDIGKLHNAQVFSREEIVIDNTLYYQKKKKKKKETKVQVNLNSVDVEFVNNLYEVAVNLLEKCKQALTGKHPIRVGIRPEDFHLNNEFDGNKAEAFNVTADVVELLGSELLIHTNWASLDMIAKISTGTLIKPHSSVELTLNKDKILIFDESCGDTI